MDIPSRYTDTRLGGLVATVIGRMRDSFVTAGRILVMSASSLRYLVSGLVKGEFQYKEFISQAWFVVGVSVIPTLLVAVPFGVIISIQIGSLAQQVGATSFIGAANGLGVIRQGAPIVVALLLAGAVGSAICSDLGARTIREEIDALEVLGISPIQRLVVPRILATMLVGVLLCGVVAFAGVLTGFLFNVLAQGGTPGSYIASFAAFAQPADLALAEVKSALFGLLVALVASYKGLNAKGGPKGVADAVNATVVLSVVLLFAVNVVITQIYSALVPQRLG
ncbi:MAG: phospholipid/cholesterol/gamma-HCH transport system permease protein [Pseudonocardiales bacterium]|nr:phospholipid/cholesterol/gamma-HCH transport system permease protein [Pseudonocardiales bacterium]MDT7627639.1 phospholipid/cholesterol/gamma-HCH transport system permease protein [Pseudonocardiales bacterium]MDT7661678.1 phospholipid/cholesterol/gamma-HCH transport system permease protein [Pseudonocardiales bacterium]MDT7748616.1 phospholipid/cholesterol/gamma-HCH transport system permease protein [Pseudonocardiales bacterium]